MKNIVLLSFLSFVLFAAPAGADRSLGPEEFASADELAYAVAAYFPKVQGAVTAVQGDKLTLALGEKNGILQGMVLTVWRDGRELLHPVTKAVIGRAEVEVGTVEVVAVQQKTSTAVLKKRVMDPMEGDRARITPKKVALGVLPLRGDGAEVINGLIGRLGELGRFTLPANDKVAAFLKDRKQRDASLIKEMGAAFSLDAVFAVSVYPTEGKFLVYGKLFAIDDGQPMETIVAVLNPTSKRESLGDVRPFFAPVKEQIAKPLDLAMAQGSSGRLPDLPLPARHFAVADLDGDGSVEYVFSDEERLFVYRADASGWKEVWKEPIAARERGMLQFHIDAADINGNGRAEIFVTRMLAGVVSSYAVEFQDGAFKRTADVPGFLRVARYPGKGEMLLGQDYDPESFFAGQPREHSWNGSGYAAGTAVSLPKGTDLYSVAFANLGESRMMLASLDSEDRLVVYSGETRIWRSEEEYRTVPTKLTKPLTGLDAAVGRTISDERASQSPMAPLPDKSRQVRIKGRFLAADLQGSGTDVLVVPKNSEASFVGNYKGGEMVALAWTGSRLEQRWSVKDLSGPVLDVQVVRPASGGARIIGLVKTTGSMFSKDTYRLETYEGK